MVEWVKDDGTEGPHVGMTPADVARVARRALENLRKLGILLLLADVVEREEQATTQLPATEAADQHR